MPTNAPAAGQRAAICRASASSSRRTPKRQQTGRCGCSHQRGAQPCLPSAMGRTRGHGGDAGQQEGQLGQELERDVHHHARGCLRQSRAPETDAALGQQSRPHYLAADLCDREQRVDPLADDPQAVDVRQAQGLGQQPPPAPRRQEQLREVQRHQRRQ
jgi:hypothetical protein